jgi:hypothetical protein
MMQNEELIKGGDGKWYRETESGDFELAEASVEKPGDLPDVSMRDAQEHERQRQGDSSREFFEKKLGPQRDDRQRLKRMEAVQRQVESLVGDRVDPGASGGIRIIKDEEFTDFLAMYQRAVAKGEQKQCEFQPLNTYQHKVVRARPILKGEVGMVGAVILRLDVGYGEGNLIAVPEHITGGPKEVAVPIEVEETESL